MKANSPQQESEPPHIGFDAAETASRLVFLEAVKSARNEGRFDQATYRACRLVLAEGLSINEASRCTSVPPDFIKEAITMVKEYCVSLKPST